MQPAASRTFWENSVRQLLSLVEPKLSRQVVRTVKARLNDSSFELPFARELIACQVNIINKTKRTLALIFSFSAIWTVSGMLGMALCWKVTAVQVFATCTLIFTELRLRDLRKKLQFTATLVESRLAVPLLDIVQFSSLAREYVGLVMNLHGQFIGADYFVAYALADYEQPGATSSAQNYKQERALWELLEVVV